jgi:hypothetical protein
MFGSLQFMQTMSDVKRPGAAAAERANPPTGARVVPVRVRGLVAVLADRSLPLTALRSVASVLRSGKALDTIGAATLREATEQLREMVRDVVSPELNMLLLQMSRQASSNEAREEVARTGGAVNWIPPRLSPKPQSDESDEQSTKGFETTFPSTVTIRDEEET